MEHEQITSKTVHPAREKFYADRLAEYKSCPPRHYLQLQAIYEPEGLDDLSPADEDGDCLHAGGAVELWRWPGVRVLIPYETDYDDAVRQLGKLLKWMEKCPTSLMSRVRPWPRDPSEDHDLF